MVMPILSKAKRKAAFEADNRALAADAVQSATCAYLAAISLAGWSRMPFSEFVGSTR